MLLKKIYVTPQKWELISCLEVDMLTYTTELRKTNIHHIGLQHIRFSSLYKLYTGFKHIYKKIVAISPTGWSGGKKAAKRANSGKIIEIWDVPYSEHSSYTELIDFVGWVKPKQIIPTVNCDSVVKVNNMLNHFKKSPTVF